MNNEEWKDGLPGVGVVCELTANDGRNWHKTALKYIDDTVFFTTAYELFKVNDPDVAFRPIKKREPKPGEVWLVGAEKWPCAYRDTINEYPFVRLDGDTSYSTEVPNEYAAPSVFAYVAREFLKQQAEQDRCYVRDIVKEAARLDEE